MGWSLCAIGTEIRGNRDNFITVSRSIIILLALLPQIALAHGVRVAASVNGEAIVGTVSYADGSPLVDVSIKLTSADPSTGDKTLGESRTNDEGRFAFPNPSKGGEFLITADDGLGHRGKVAVVTTSRVVPSAPVMPATPAVPTPVANDPNSPSNWARWVSGLGYVIGLFGLASWWLSRRGAMRSRD
jgi:nickel transport protein